MSSDMHGALHDSHGVDDGHSGRAVSTGRTDVDVDWGSLVLALEIEQFRDHHAGHLRLYLAVNHDDAVFKQTAVDVLMERVAVRITRDYNRDSHVLLVHFSFPFSLFSVKSHPRAHPLSHMRQGYTGLHLQQNLILSLALRHP